MGIIRWVAQNFYDRTQSLQGLLWQASMAQKARQPQAESSPAPNPPIIMQLRRGLAESPAWFMVQALEFDPEPLSVARLRVRAIYSSERIAAALLELLATEGWLDYQGQGEYIPTTAGREVMERIRQRPFDWLAGLDTTLTDAAGLERLWHRVLTACLETEPDGPWCLRYSRRRAPADSAPAVVKINQYCADFNAFRDDAHMAAFRPYGVSGQVWEAFWYVWQGQADTVAGIQAALLHRGFSLREMGLAVTELVERGWLAAADDAPHQFTITSAGRAIRTAAEQATNERFYAPFACLNAVELDEMEQRLSRLERELVQISEQ